MLKFDAKEFVLTLRRIILDLNKVFEANRDRQDELLYSKVDLDEVQHWMRVCFGILTNLAKHLDNYLHLFLPDFNRIFIKRPQKNC
jgi:hypothetical protein